MAQELGDEPTVQPNQKWPVHLFILYPIGYALSTQNGDQWQDLPAQMCFGFVNDRFPKFEIGPVHRQCPMRKGECEMGFISFYALQFPPDSLVEGGAIGLTFNSKLFQFRSLSVMLLGKMVTSEP